MSNEILRMKYFLKPFILVFIATICFYAFHAYDGPALYKILIKVGVIIIVFFAALIRRDGVFTRLR